MLNTESDDSMLTNRNTPAASMAAERQDSDYMATAVIGLIDVILHGMSGLVQT